MKNHRPAAVHKGMLFGVLLFLLLGGAAVWFFFLRPQGPPEFSAVGGTILVYEVDNAKNEIPVEASLLAQALQKRLEGADLPHAKVNPFGKDQVELRIARWKGKEQDDQDVQQVKDLIARIGQLEFRILANQVDDAMGQEAAQRTIEAAKDLEERAQKGLPPPPPASPDNQAVPGVFEVTLAKGQKSKVSYDWVEIGPQERISLNLDNAAENDPVRNHVWLQAREKLNQATRYDEPGGHRKLMQGALFFARVCQDRNMTEAERRQKKFEYFVLARDPEFDVKDPTRRIPRMDGSFLSSASMDQSNDGRPAVWFNFNAAGAELFGQLTGKNVPSGNGPEGNQLKRHLAIILDGQVMSVPTINSEIRDRGQISGHFTQKEVANLTALLRSGALPATLKPQPISETTVEPVKKK